MTSAVVIWLTVWVFGVNWYVQYAIWAIPFLIMSGRLVATAALEVVLTTYWLRYLQNVVPALTRIETASVVVATAWVAWLGGEL